MCHVRTLAYSNESNRVLTHLRMALMTVPLSNGPSPFTNLYLVLLFHMKLYNNHGKYQKSRGGKSIDTILEIKSPRGMKYIILNTRNQVLECNILFKSGTLTAAEWADH